MNVLYQQLGIMYVLILLGFVLRRINFIRDEDINPLSKFTMSVSMPAAILSGMNISYTRERGLTILFVFGLQILMTVMTAIAFYAVYKQVRKQIPGHGKTFLFGLLFCNAAMVSLPVVKTMFSENEIFAATINTIAMNLLFYTLGMAILRSDDEQAGKINPRDVLNPVSMIIVAGLILFLFHFTYPSIAGKTISALGGCCMPLGMTLTGALLAEGKIMEMFTDARAWVISLIRVLVIPLATFLVMRYGMRIQDLNLILAMTIMFACPLPTALPPMTRLYGGDIKLATHLTSLSAIICCVTMPLVYRLVMMLY